MKRTKREQGITLIALIITIIVLLILAVVAIGAVQNDGIINHAKNAKEEYGKAQVNENTTLENYLAKLDENAGNQSLEGNGSSVESKIFLVDEDGNDAQDKVLSTTDNTNVYDEYGNKIVVPAGFKITTDANNVTEGIVIEDCTETATVGSQFVWVPVGTIYTNAEKTESKTITLGRYSYFNANDEGEYIPVQKAEDYATATVIDSFYTEDTAENHDSNKKNAIAKDLKGFIESASTKGGYYLGRYEAGNLNDTLLCKANQAVYRTSQLRASELSRDMYKDSTTFTSDLVNSYAWDTAVVFIQTFSGCADYAYKNFSTSFANTGINPDKYCNIHDMSGNANEWTTETPSGNNRECVERGGYFNAEGMYVYSNTIERSTVYSAGVYYNYNSFRPLLYV